MIELGQQLKTFKSIWQLSCSEKSPSLNVYYVLFRKIKIEIRLEDNTDKSTLSNLRKWKMFYLCNHPDDLCKEQSGILHKETIEL